MPITPSQCEREITAMSPEEELRFLPVLGHWLTVAARGTYEFQRPGVKDPEALRAFNELHHRLYAQLRSLATEGTRSLDAEDITSWLTGEDQPPEFQASCLWAFEEALKQFRENAA